ncbi:barstar family protein [Kamptonema animale CS-326]|jgi:RNAse (barnase) inhibitor barstar|uniref:barstar family protein n=1 Tax=Kamptonema animale TaxID=92934 RepID=UPI00232B02B3|nr:barstar family protein [Kamptonema animale]MDB9513546.1 barstar family protein [Kamptonema animale CS-326]
MKQLLEVIKGDRQPGLYGVTGEIKIDELSSLCQQHGLQFFHIEGKDIASKTDLLKASAKAMSFPAYFGSNWDAFEDCITDLDWVAAKGYILLYSQPENFARNNPSDWATAIDIFRSAVEYWQATSTPMSVLIKANNLNIKNLEIL